MAGKGATLALKITGDASGGSRALDEVDGKAGRLGGVFGKLGGSIAAGAAVGGAALVALGVSAFNAASDAQQAAGAVDAVFGKNAAQMKLYAANAAETVGLSAASYNQLSSVLGAQLANAGYAGDQLSGTVNTLVGLGSDLAAQFGGSTADAVEALSSVLKGETDPIERYGVSVKQSDIAARLAADGQDKLTGAALKQATAQAALALVTEQTKSAQGAFGRESDTAAGATQRLGAMWDNFQASIGSRLLPVVTKAANFLKDTVLPVVSSWTEEGGFLFTAWQQLSAFFTGQLIPALTSLWNEIGPKLLPIIAEVGGFITGFLVPAFLQIWSIVATYVIPIIKTVLGPALSGIGTAFHTVTAAIMAHKDTFLGLYNSLKPFLAFLRDQVAPVVGGIFKTGFELAGKAIGGVVTVISFLVDKIKWILDKGAAVGKFIGGLFGAGSAPNGRGGARRTASPLRGAAAGGQLFGAAGSLAAAGSGPSAGSAGLAVGDTYNITVTGALDPMAVAEQIGRLLEQRARRTGGSVSFAVAA